MFSQTVDPPYIADRMITLKFNLVTDTDEQILHSLAPEEITDISQWSGSIPGCLIDKEDELVRD